MGKIADMTGLRFGRLVGVRRDGLTRFRHVTWLWRCDCGNEKVIAGTSVRSGLTTSCGCYSSEVVKRTDNKSSKHRMTSSLTYWSWTCMVARCTNPSAADFPRYGGRGIKVCEEWMSFQNFIADMGVRPVGKTLDRIDNDGNYEKSNCKWSTLVEQQRNRRSVRLLEYRGQIKRLPEWSEIVGIKPRVIRERLDAGWSTEMALSTPVAARNKK